MNAKISVFIICVEVIIYLLLYNLHGCTFNMGILPIPKLSRNVKGYLMSFLRKQEFTCELFDYLNVHGP